MGVDGHKEVLGIWLESNEGAKFWLKLISELKHRGVQDVLIACCDGLKGFPQTIEAVLPKSVVQTCIVHMIRNSMRFVGWVQRKAVWDRVRPFFDFPPGLRKLIYTTNAIESLNFQLRTVPEAKGNSPNDEAAIKLLYLALRNAEKRWTMVPCLWNSALNQLVIYFPGRLPA